MRLAMVIAHFSPGTGGAEAYAVAVARDLVRRGHEVHVFARDGHAVDGICLDLGTPANLRQRLAAAKPDLTVDWGLTYPADVHRLGGGITREFQQYNLLRHGCAGRCWRQLLYLVSPGQHLAIARERRLLSRPPAHLLAVSNFVAGQVRRRIPGAASRMQVLVNGVDTERFAPRHRDGPGAALRRSLSLPPNTVLFLFLAHNPALKNFRLLQTIFDELTVTLPQARLLALGKHAPRVSRPWLIHAGAAERPEDYYAAADVLLHPTFYDACANVVLEALAAGLPVVSSDLNGSAEVITHGQDGFVLPVTGDADTVQQQWHDLVVRLTVDAELRHRTGQAARRLALQHAFDLYMDKLEAYLLQRAAPATE